MYVRILGMLVYRDVMIERNENFGFRDVRMLGYMGIGMLEF